jgi:hypothetical protein
MRASQNGYWLLDRTSIPDAKSWFSSILVYSIIFFGMRASQ